MKTNINLESFVTKTVRAEEVFGLRGEEKYAGMSVKVLDGYDFFYERAAEGADLVYEGVDYYSEDGSATFREFLKENKITYYAAPREDFFEFIGIREAFDEGSEYIFMEDLS